jgi:hypothetical protein
MLSINPKWVLEQVGVDMDEETAELVTFFMMRLKASPDKKEFLKDCLRKAMSQVDEVGPVKRKRKKS